MLNCLILNLAGPMMSFGLSRKAHRGPTDVIPAKSLITGLLGNALGWQRGRHQDQLNRLQDRLVIAARTNHAMRPNSFLEDYQRAQLSSDDAAWTTSGKRFRRASPRESLQNPHIRLQSYIADGHVTIAARLDPPDEDPTASELAAALQYPERPLFIGRKTCLPTQFIFQDLVETDSAIEALLGVPLSPGTPPGPPLITRWESRETLPGAVVERSYPAPGVIDWYSHLESGWIWWLEAQLPQGSFAAEPELPGLTPLENS